MKNLVDMLNGPIVMMSEEEQKINSESELKNVVDDGENKKRLVLNFLKENSSWKIQDIVKKFDLAHDVKKDLENGLVKMSFFADESMTVECFELTMPYSEVLEKLK